MKEEIIYHAVDNIRGLHELKEKGFKIERLNFKSKITSIPLYYEIIELNKLLIIKNKKVNNCFKKYNVNVSVGS